MGVCGHVGLQVWMGMCGRVDLQMQGRAEADDLWARACGCDSCRRVGMQMRMSVEEKERKNKLTACGCADANECKKKRRKKRNLLGMGACRHECIACGWCCMRMRCMGTWMVIAAEMVGMDECKEKTKK